MSQKAKKDGMAGKTGGVTFSSVGCCAPLELLALGWRVLPTEPPHVERDPERQMHAALLLLLLPPVFFFDSIMRDTDKCSPQTRAALAVRHLEGRKAATREESGSRRGDLAAGTCPTLRYQPS